MPLSLTVALSVVAMLASMAVPAIMLVTAGASGSFRQWTAGFVGWLIVVFSWVLLQFHVFDLAPHYFRDSNWDDFTIFTGIVAVMLQIWSYARTALHN